ncbi:HetZ-related protein [Leptolyngbya sp. FACHB-711]|uniref:HetZ-related protein n=1 Tax=Leptolyngbya sp. FACHB-711 TaxID=2692813 RepID=UPI001684133A|nr:HetZ-related protein [Leptolyngbya sp. FACHB-711]MBD1850530.1 HetZ-related protein [Cyanobacteria bacterium FACHB-502]MBD2027335.1 HetZ-related protein [Leptolyngbya sp. FACHB-711]
MNSEPVNSSCFLSVASEFPCVIPNPFSSVGDLPDAPIQTNSSTPHSPVGVNAAPVNHTSEYSAADLQLREELTAKLLSELETEAISHLPSIRILIDRILTEVERICDKSDRIRSSGQQQTWLMTLAQHRLKKCLSYYKLGSKRGRVELHSHLSTMVYRHIVATQTQMGFSARYGLIEDFLQGFYIEVLKAFRRENILPEDYSPRTRLELAEYMAFTEHYAKRRIALPGRRTQQLIVLRAQGFAHRQPPETAIDLEMAIESAKSEEAEQHSRSPLVQQVREQMTAETTDPTDFVLRDRVITELISYLEAQGQPDCVDYLTLKLQDLSAPEIDEILNLSPRQRDYLQQRFKYHVEKFARSHRWQLVHQWLGADLDQNLGMPLQQWEAFLQQLTPDQHQLLRLKTQKHSDQEIAKALRCTLKQVQKRWVALLELAWQTRNSTTS